MTIDPTTGRVVGEHYFIAVDRGSPESITLGGAEFAASFGPGRYSVFTCVDFKGDGYNFTSPTEWGSWLGNFPVGFTVNLNQVYFGELNHMEMGLACLFFLQGFVSELVALLTFPRNPDQSSTTTILARVGVSFISSDQACANAESEIPDFDFEGVQSASEDQWRELLSRVQVNTTGVDDETVELLYSSVCCFFVSAHGISLANDVQPSSTGRTSLQLIVSKQSNVCTLSHLIKRI